MSSFRGVPEREPRADPRSGCIAVLTLACLIVLCTLVWMALKGNL